MVLGADDRDRAVRHARDAGRPDGHDQRLDVRPSSACSSRPARRRDREPGRPGARAVAHRGATAGRRHRPATRCRRSTSGGVGRAAVGGVPGGATRCCCNLHDITRRRRRRLHHHQPAVAAVDAATSVDKTLTILLGRHRRDLAAGRRDRGDEHHAGVGHRADPRDRAAQGARRAAAARSAGSSWSRRRCSAWPAGCSAPASGVVGARGAAAPVASPIAGLAAGAGRRARHRDRRSASSSASIRRPGPRGWPPSTPCAASKAHEQQQPTQKDHR